VEKESKRAIHYFDRRTSAASNRYWRGRLSKNQGVSSNFISREVKGGTSMKLIIDYKDDFWDLLITDNVGKPIERYSFWKLSVQITEEAKE